MLACRGGHARAFGSCSEARSRFDSPLPRMRLTRFRKRLHVDGEAPKPGAMQHKQQQKMQQKWIAWVLGDLCLVLLRSHFYVTEGQTQRQLCLYYRCNLFTPSPSPPYPPPLSYPGASRRVQLRSPISVVWLSHISLRKHPVVFCSDLEPYIGRAGTNPFFPPWRRPSVATPPLHPVLSMSFLSS